MKQQTVRFEPWPHLMRLFDELSSQKLLIVLKARQLGVTSLLAAYSVWYAQFHENSKVLILSRGEEEAYDVLSKCRFIHAHLGEGLRGRREPDQRGFIGFPDTDSEIRALPSTEHAGRSTDASLVIVDEMEFHPYAEANFGALKPTIDAGGQFVGVSTADKLKLNTFFKVKYLEARAGRSQFKPIFLSWRERPGRDDQWFSQVTRDLRPYQVESEYPETEEEALTTLKSRRFFDDAALSQMKQFVSLPLKHEMSDKYQGLVRIYKLPVVGRKYCLFTDPSDGKDDPHASIVIDAITAEEVAESHGRVPADRCAQIHDELVRYFNNAFNSYETNARAGGIFSEKIKELATPNQCAFLRADGTLDVKGKTGWWTSRSLWSRVIWGLEEAVRLMQITPHSPECLDEFNQFIVPEGEDPQKPGGGSDDYIDAWSRVWLLRKYVPQAKRARAVSGQYRES